MRTTLVSSMMDSLSRNEAKSNEEAALFEIGNVYLPTEDALPIENEKLVVGLYGKDLFYKLKGIVEIIRDEFFLEKVTFKRSEEPYFHPGKAAEVMLDKKTFLVHCDINKLGTGFKGYMKDIDEVLKSSGFDIADKAAIINVQRTQPFPPPPRNFDDSFRVPIVFRPSRMRCPMLEM